MSAPQQLNVAPSGSDNLVIANNLVWTTVEENGVAVFTQVNIVPNTWLQGGVTQNPMVSGTSYQLAVIPVKAGTYQTNFSATYTGTSFGANDYMDYFWAGSATTVPIGSTDTITLCTGNYSTVRSLGTINSTDTFTIPSAQNIILSGRFTGTATNVATTLYPYLTYFKIA